MVERVLHDLAAADSNWNIIALRYFNPAGAHPSGQIGEAPGNTPTNLLPFITQVAVGRRQQLSVFGGNFDTRDGTGVRDYLHVCDLAEAHVKALQKLADRPGFLCLNLGTGRGVSVLEIIRTFEAVSGQKIPYKITAPRAGDIAESYADSTLAQELLGWSARLSLEDMLRDAWHWQQRNPDGYNG